MAKLYNLLFAASALPLLTLVACDNIDEDERYIPVEKPVLPPHAVPKVLLIQEFTGVRCANCPTGAETIHTIQEEYPGQVIAVGMHPKSGGFTDPWPDNDFRSEEAEVMYTYYKPDGFPCAIFNGTRKSETIIDWSSQASQLMNQEAFMTIDAKSDFDTESNSGSVDYTITLTGDVDRSLNVMVWLMENGITGFQLSSGPLIPNYTHNHVLRCSLNGDWGEALGSKFENGQIITGSAKIDMKDGWKAENCQIVVYVFDSSSKEVEQAALVDVIAADEPDTPDNGEETSQE